MNTSQISITRMIVGIVAAALLGSMTLFPAMSASAQDVSRSSGTLSETLASVSVVEGGSRLVLMRFTLKPDATIQAHSHSGPAMFTVVSGTLQTELIRGGATVTRGGVEESAEIGAVTHLSGGESIAFAANAGAKIANLGSEPLLLVATILLEANEPVFDFDYWAPPSRPNVQ